MGISDSSAGGNTHFSMLKQLFSVFTQVSINKANMNLVFYIYLQLYSSGLPVSAWKQFSGTKESSEEKKETNIHIWVFYFHYSR